MTTELGSSCIRRGLFRRWIVSYAARLIRTVRFRLFTTIARVRLRFNGVEIQSGLLVTGWLRLCLHPRSRVKIGRNVVIRSGHYDNPVGAYVPTSIFVGDAGFLEVQDGAGLSNCTIIAYERISIGPSAFLGGGTRVYDSNFHPLDLRKRVSRSDPPLTKPVDIGAGAFVGGHSLILKGVSIGDRAIVGAGSVLTRSVPADEIWAGNPARFVRAVGK
jgi:acetyltransferase-like isoleucine patch superfamily enzyme